MRTSKSAETLSAERLVLLDEAKSLGDKASCGRELTDAEAARFDELTADDGLVAQKTAEWEKAGQFESRVLQVERDRRHAEASGAAGWNGFGPSKTEPAHGDTGRPSKANHHEPFALCDSSGQWHRAEAATTPLAPKAPADAPKAGELLAFWLTQDERHLNGKNPMNAVTGHGSGASGGFLIPNTISGEFVDLARTAMVTGRAGTRSMTLDSAEMKVIKVASDPTGGYYSELGTIEASRPTFSSITLRPHKFAILIPISREAIEDGANLPGILETTSIAAIAQAMDAAVLGGSEINGPTGILNTVGVNKTESVGTPTSYSEILGAVRKVYDANFQGDVSDLTWIHSPREWETYAGLVTTGSGADGQPLQMPPKLADLTAYATTAMPVNEGGGQDESSMVVGHFPSSVLAIRTGSGVRAEFLNAGTGRDAEGKTINAITDDATWLRFTVRFDVAVLRPDHFTVLSGVTAS